MNKARKSQPIDLTRLYIVSVLREKVGDYLPPHSKVVNFEQMEQLVDNIASTIPAQHRVIQTVEACPEQSMSLIDEDKREALKQVMFNIHQAGKVNQK